MIESDRIRLRPLRYGDIHILYKWINDYELMKFMHLFRPVSESEQRDWFNSLSKNNEIFFGIELKENEKLIGRCRLYKISQIDKTAKINIFIGEKSLRHKGYAKEAMKIIIDYAFNYLNFRKIWSELCVDNKPVINLYKKLGFKDEGLLRKHYFLNGSYRDILVVGLLKNDNI